MKGGGRGKPRPPLFSKKDLTGGAKSNTIVPYPLREGRSAVKKKFGNFGALLPAVFATPFGLAGGFYWAVLSHVYHSQNAVFILCFIFLGMVAPLLGLTGGILAYGFRRSGCAVAAFAALCAAALVVLSCVYAGEFRFVGEIFTLVSLALLAVTIPFSLRRAPEGAFDWERFGAEDEEDEEDEEPSLRKS